MFQPKQDRKIIPRWRDFRTTALLGQLGTASPEPTPRVLGEAAQLESLISWSRNPTLWHALDLVSSAFVLGDEQNADVLAAAQFLSRHPHCPQPAQELVSKILHPHGTARNATQSNIDEELIRLMIHAKRERLSDEPRNSVLWTDVACLYTSLGFVDKARRAIEISYNLAADNRFVLRSAARFFLHIKEPDRALKILRQSELNDSDPWVVGAEIGASSFSGEHPRLLKTGKRMLATGDFSDFSISELASAMATVEINDGNRKASRKLFRQSLAVPTENSVAQAQWASTLIGDLEIESRQIGVPLNYEAKVLLGYKTGDWDGALLNAQKWFNDQPFSSGPAAVLANIYSSVFERYEDAIKVLRFGLNSNPGDRFLFNNLAFALINVGDLSAAESVLRKTNPRAADDNSTITLIATSGLFSFRSGSAELGRELYLEAIEIATRKGNSQYAALAAIYLAMEEIRSYTENALQAFHRAVDLASKLDDPYVEHIMKRLRLMASVAKI